jgi:hypothetical protein
VEDFILTAVVETFQLFVQGACKYPCLGAWTLTAANVGHGPRSVASVYARGWKIELTVDGTTLLVKSGANVLTVHSVLTLKRKKINNI